MKEKIGKWFYEFVNGHPFLLEEEVDIIIETRLHDRENKWMNDDQIQELVRIRVKAMYKRKFPNAKLFKIFKTK